MKLGPNELSQTLLESYLRYLLSAHPIGTHNPSLEAALRERLRDGRELIKGPILELDPASRRGATITALVNDGILCGAFRSLDAQIPNLATRQLYTHQEGALKAAVAGRSVVVASGTGSGKTEAWLYAIVNELLKNPSSGLRAIVLYPMNALADDQRRIRMRTLLRNTAITYGEYTGNTPSGTSDRANLDSDAPSNELQTRKQMRATPPNILITNPSMLEYLLLRPEDSALFHGSHLQFLVLDEAHTYRGAYGIELGHLIRRLKSRLQLPQRSLATFVLSATIAKDLPAIQNFAENLTGEPVAINDIFFGEPEVAQAPAELVNRPPETYSILTNAALVSVLADPASLLSVPDINRFGEEAVLRAAEARSGEQALYQLLHDDANVVELGEALRVTPRDISALGRDLFGSHDVDVDGTMARLVDAAASARVDSDNPSLLPARYHLFLRALDGLRVCFNPAHPSIGFGAHSVGTFYTEQRETCDCGHGLWELLVCGDCAAWYVRDCRDLPASGSSDDTGAAGSLCIVDTDDDLTDETEGAPSAQCLLCRGSASACACAPKLLRAVVHTGKRKTCLNCGGSSVLPVMTGSMAPTQILAEVLTSHQTPDPAYEGRRSGKKLLAFSDSRGSAAQFAAQLDRSHKQHVRRAAIYQALRGVEEPIGIDQLARRVARILQDVGYWGLSANNRSRAAASVFEEFTASYATRRRLVSLGLGASKLLLDESIPSEITAMFETPEDAESMLQALLEIIQYDSAVTKPEDMADLQGVASLRPDVFYSLRNGPKRWTSPDAAPHQRQRNRLFNMAARLVGTSNADRLLTAIWKYAVRDGVLTGSNDRMQIDSDRMVFFSPSIWYRCDACRRVTPWATETGRGCPTKNCEGTLRAKGDAVQRNDHFTRNIIEPIEYFRVEEHTAQIEKDEARRIGHEFRSGDVNILSCSTTFELGVDIGTLQSVFMRNVPPSVANYRQRAGRAGRSRQGAAFLLTFCGSSPHDRVFFQNPTDIIVGELSVPEFNLSNKPLLKRHINSMLFSELWRFVANKLGAKTSVEEFFLSSEVDQYWAQWVASPSPTLQREFESYAAAARSKLSFQDSLEIFNEALAAEKRFIETGVASLKAEIPNLSGNAMSNAANELRRLRERSLIEHLSARAFLPSYAFPIYTVELRTADQSVSLQRDLRVAIGEYAPGRQVVANKRIFESVGIVLRDNAASAKTPFQKYWYCKDCHAAFTSVTETCACGSELPIQSGTYVVPDGFITDMTKQSRETVAKVRRDAMHITQHVLSSGEPGSEITLGPVRARKYENAELLFVNHGTLSQEFRICGGCGTSVPLKQNGEHKTPFGRKCKDPVYRSSIGHRLIGEALSLQFDAGDGFQIPEDRIFFETLSYAILEGISKALSIERRDLGATVRTVAHAGQLVWEVLILDNVPGGAGYVAQIVRGSGLADSLREAAKVADCGACIEDSTCYSCLRSMSNQHLHSRMERGPVRDFLRSLCERIAGNKGIFGLTLEPWLCRTGAHEVVVAMNAVSDSVGNALMSVGPGIAATLIVDADQPPHVLARLEAWAQLWPERVRIVTRALEGRPMLIGVRDADGWQVIVGASAADAVRGTISSGNIIEGKAADAAIAEVRKETVPFTVGRALPGWTRLLKAGEKTSERALFGDIFEKAINTITLEDPYLFQARHELRIKAWLDLVKTSATCIIKTTKPYEPEDQRKQAALFSRLKSAYGSKHNIQVKHYLRTAMHDRNVIIETEDGEVLVSLPKGLDFINHEGIVDVPTSVTVLKMPA